MSVLPFNHKPTGYAVPDELLQPLWFRSQESLAVNGLVYDPIAAQACQRCQLSTQCRSGQFDKQQRLYASLTLICDQQISSFLQRYPTAWVINIASGLDTRFYRLDNGRCRWIEVDSQTNLNWRSQLFHRSERFYSMVGSIEESAWISQLPDSDGKPVLIVCESAFLKHDQARIMALLQRMSCQLPHAYACIVLAGDKAGSLVGRSLGCVDYQHGVNSVARFLKECLPPLLSYAQFSPLRYACRRWAGWPRYFANFGPWTMRFLPRVVFVEW